MKKILIFMLIFYLSFAAGCNSDKKAVSENAEAYELTAHFPELKGGKCVFFELPNGESMLIDAGAAEDFPDLFSYLRERGVHIIDYLILTSADGGHIGGAVKLMQNMQVNEIYISKYAQDAELYKQVTTEAAVQRCLVRTAFGGTEVLSDDGLNICIVSPLSEDYRDVCDYTLSVVVSYDENSFFIEGDCSDNAENDMLEALGGYMHSDVLCVANCGAGSTSSPAFVQMISPLYAVIPMYKSDAKHPSPGVVQALEKSGAKVFKTNSDGTVVLKSDGKRLSVNTQR